MRLPKVVEVPFRAEPTTPDNFVRVAPAAGSATARTDEPGEHGSPSTPADGSGRRSAT